MKYRKKTVLTEATQWFQNGDHPQDESEPIANSGDPPRLSEGKVVQYYRSLDAVESLDAMNTSGRRFCPECGNLMEKHGVLDGANGEEMVCPGDYIVTNRDGLYYRLSRGVFESQYERYIRPPKHNQVPVSDREKLLQQRERR